MLTITTLAPEGSSKAYDAAMPSTKHTTDIIAEHTTTDLKLRQRRMLVSAGKMMRLDINSAPIMRIPSTTVTAVRTAIIVLYRSALVPVALAKVSSKVTANIRGYSSTNIKSTIADNATLNTASARLKERILPNI